MSTELAKEACGDGMFKVKEAAAFLSISVNHLYVMMGRGDLPYSKLGKRRLIPRAAVVALAASGMSGGSSLA